MIILDEYFKELVLHHLGDGLTEDKLKVFDPYLETFDSSSGTEVLNILKVSSDMRINFIDVHKEIRNNTSKVLPDKFVIALTVNYLVAIMDRQIREMLKEHRDFVAEVAAQKFKLPVEAVTEENKYRLLNDPTDVYSITDPPVDNWDEYFFNVCRQAARHSKCLSRRIGAVLVKDKSIVSTGYNSPPRGVPRCDERWTLDANFITKYKDKIVNPLDTTKPMCPRYSLGAKSGEMLDLCVAGHAEENAILNAAWHGIATKGATLFLNCGIPCFRCLIKIINAGISEIVVTGITFYDDNAEFLLNNSTVKVRLYNFK